MKEKEEKDVLLLEISSLIKAQDSESDIDLEVMRFLSIEELTKIKDSLIGRKENRAQEQEDWYNEWVKNCGK